MNCAWDAINIFLDWAAVVAACGAPVVNVFVCAFSITWATADTIKNAADMAGDCVPAGEPEPDPQPQPAP